ncbi:MAG TPA: type II secretion system F family protein, partial [Candidatus Paceibacterota bacterium]|nr:type II secretion system F family protein [Candidatus Paceibacterota bacterium]
MRFHYKAKKDSGIDVEGDRESENKFSLARELRAEGLTLVAVEEAGSKKRGLGEISLFNRVSLKDKIIFANNLGSMITAGLTLSRALNIMQRQSTNAYFKKVLTAIEEKISRGDSLHAAMEG